MDGYWIRRYSHVSDDVRVNEGALVVALELFAAHTAALRLVAEALCWEWGRAGALANGPYGRLLREAARVVACR